MRNYKPKAPAGCYWKGDTLFGRVRLAGAPARQWSLATDDPKIARERYEAGKAKIVAAHRFGDARHTYDDAVEEWAKHIKSAVSPKTVQRYAGSLNQIAEKLEGRVLTDITPKLLAEIVSDRKTAGASNATIKRDLIALSSVLNIALGADMLPANPVLVFLAKNKKTALLKERRDPMVLPRERDIALVKSRAPGMMAHLIDAARFTGARQDELIKAKIEHLDRRLRQFTVIGKRNKQRTIELSPAAYEFLAGLPAYLKSPNMFWHHEGDQYTNFASHFHRLVKQTAKWAKANKVDFVPFKFHALRHLHAIEFLKSGAGTVHDLQFRLGHTSVMTTEIYLKAGLLTAAEVRAAMHGSAAPTLRVVGGKS